MHGTILKMTFGKKLLIGGGALLATLGGAHAYAYLTGRCPLADLHDALHHRAPAEPGAVTAHAPQAPAAQP